MDEEEMIMMTNHHYNDSDEDDDDDYDDEHQKITTGIGSTGRPAEPTQSSHSVIFRIQFTNRNMLRNLHTDCFYISCQVSTTTLYHLQDIVFCHVIFGAPAPPISHPNHPNNDHNNDEFSHRYQYYQQNCHYRDRNQPNTMHNPLIFHPPTSDPRGHVAAAAPFLHSMYHIRFIVMGQLLLTTTTGTEKDHDNHHHHNPTAATLDTIPPLKKLLVSSSTLQDDDAPREDTVITIHAVITKRNDDDDGTTQKVVVPTKSPAAPLFPQQQQPHRIEPEDDEDLLFYPEEEEEDLRNEDLDHFDHFNRHDTVSLFHNDDEDEDEDDASILQSDTPTMNPDSIVIDSNSNSSSSSASSSNSSILEEINEDEDQFVPTAVSATTTSRNFVHGTDLSQSGERQRRHPLDAHSQRPTTHYNNQNDSRRHPHRNRNIPLGFDALRVTAGLSRSEITILRLYFNHEIDVWIQQHPIRTTSILLQMSHSTMSPTTTASTNNNNIDTLRLRRLQEEAWMNEQGPYSEFRYNINAPSSFLQQQRTRTRTTNNITTRNGSTTNNNNNNNMDLTSPLLSLPLPPSPASDENLSNNPNRRRDGRRRRHDSNHNNSHFATTSITRAIRNRVTTGSNDALTMYRRATAGNNNNSGGGTILPLHNANTSHPGGNHNVMTMHASLGSDRDFVYGFIFGSMVGSCMLLWIWIPTVSYKQKLGILFGYALHITMNMIHKSLHGGDPSDSQEHMLSPDEVNYNNYQYSRNFLINDDTLQLGE